MKITLRTLLLAAIAAAVLAGFSTPLFAQTANPSAATQRLAGRWEAKREDVPSVVLRIAENGSAVAGQVDFYILKKTGAGAPIQAGKMTAAMVNPRLRGSTLDFEVVRPSDGSVLNFSLELTGEHTARLVRTGGGEENLEVDMTRVE